jgi:peptidoglycan hydrolase CwlO-like protein
MANVVGLPKVVDDVGKLQQDVAVVAALVDRLEAGVNRFDKQTETLHARISSGEREIKKQIDEQYDELMKEIKDMRAESVQQHNSLSERITSMEKWMWTVVGGATAISFILSQVDLAKLFS